MFTDEFILSEIYACSLVCPDGCKIRQIRELAYAGIRKDPELFASVMSILDAAIAEVGLPAAEE